MHCLCYVASRTSSVFENNVIAFRYGSSSIFKAEGEEGGESAVLPARIAMMSIKTGIVT